MLNWELFIVILESHNNYKLSHLEPLKSISNLSNVSQGVFSLGNTVESVSNTFHHEHYNAIVAVTSSYPLPLVHSPVQS